MIVTIASLVYIWQTLQGEALSEFWANLGKGQYGWLLVGFAMQALSVIARS